MQHEPARRHGAWNSTAVRLIGLLVCLGVLVFALVAKAGDGGGSSRSISACVGRVPAPATIDFAELTRLRATLLGALAHAGGRRYQSGPAQPTALWTDDSPRTIAAARGRDGSWPAGYEVRRWSSAGDDIAADAFTFRTRAQARALFDAASSARCHEHGKTGPAFAPPGARNLLWVNPDAALQADALLLRGSTVYRVAVVRGRYSPARSATSYRPTTVAIANGLACALPGRGARRRLPRVRRKRRKAESDGRAYTPRMADPGATVLVTGGTGFLGGWCGAELLRRGYAVRTTVRDLRRADDVRASFAAAGVEPGERLSIVAADLGADDGWEDAVAGCEYVLHVASPFPPAQPKDPDELIVPARDGALRVLRASLDAGVQRVVMTSSVAAVRHGRAPSADAPYNESDWTDGDDVRRTPYVRSKAIAERAAWDLVRERGAENRLATVNPGAIIGPVLSDDRSFSLQVIERLLNGMPAMPRLGFVVVDVRDVADLHIRAMTAPGAGGERFLAVDRFMWMADVGRILRERLGTAAAKVPTRIAPNLLIRAMGMFDPSVRSIVSDLGESPAYTAEKAKTTLGWQPRPVEDSIAETAQSLIERGLAGAGAR